MANRTEPQAPTVAAAPQQQQQQQTNTVAAVGTVPAGTVQLAPQPTLYAVFERPSGTGENVPVVRCVIPLDGAFRSLDMAGFTFWKTKSGDIQIRLPGMRGFPTLKPSAVQVEINGEAAEAQDPAGKRKLDQLETILYAAYLQWSKRPEAFPGNRVPLSLGA